MKKALHLFLAIFAFTYASAQDFSVGDYGFTIDGANVKVHSYTGAGGDITIPDDAFDGTITYPVTSIGVGAFLDNTTITGVMLPSTVTILEQNAFSGCTGIVTMNCDNIVELGQASLGSLTSLTDYGTFNSLTTMARNSFFGLSSLTVFELPDTLTVYDIGVGNTFSKVKTFNIPSTVVSIGNAFFRFVPLVALQANWSADQVSGTNGVTAVSISATNFLGGQDLSTITLYVPAGTKSDYEAHPLLGGFNVVEGTLADIDTNAPAIGDTFTEGDYDYTVTSITPLEAEVSGSTLANVVVPANATDTGNSTTYSITAIGTGAFLGNTSVTSVGLPTSVVLLKSNAFSGAVNLETINLENVVTIETQNAFFNCPKLETANLAAATSIGNFAFHGFGDSTLSSISIPSAITIGNSAFRTSAISSINIPETVTTMADRVFMDCTSLTGIQVNWTTAGDIAVIVATVFENLTPGDITLYVPAGTTALYQAAVGWQDLNIVEGVLSVQDVNEVNFNVYPNPTSDLVSITSLDTIVNVTVVNAIGSVVLNSISTQLDFSNFVSGVYFVKVETARGTSVKRVIKN